MSDGIVGNRRGISGTSGKQKFSNPSKASMTGMRMFSGEGMKKQSHIS
jgi:hypothetical protein